MRPVDVICGQGRLGQRVAAQLAAAGRPLLPARIDPVRGLTGLPGGSRHIGLLLICLTPVHPPGQSGWLGLLDGLQARCAAGELTVAELVLVSSSAVYECHASGFVEADTPVHPISVRSEGLIAAERQARQLSPATQIARLTGLTGPGYERYDPRSLSHEQPRHAIDVRAAAAALARLALTPRAGVELLTDGCVYWHGESRLAQRDVPLVQSLAVQHRVLIPSQSCHWPDVA